MNFDKKDLKPMLLHEIDEPFNNKNYIFELKFDGIRALIYTDGKDITIVSRNGVVLNNNYPELLEIKNRLKKKVIFDGEIVLFKDGKPSFETLQERMRLKDKAKINSFKVSSPVTFVCFDILYENRDLTDLPLIERKKILEKYEDTNVFTKIHYIEENGILLFNAVKEMELEGIVAKEINSKYMVNKRSNSWLKIKNLKDDDFYICGYKDNNKNNISILLGEKNSSNFIFIGKVTITKSHNDYKTITSQKESKNKLVNFDDKTYTFLNPKLKCTVSFLEKTKNNSLRHPIFKCLKD